MIRFDEVVRMVFFGSTIESTRGRSRSMQMSLNASSGTSPIVIAIDLTLGGGRTPSSDLQCLEDMDP